MVTRYEASNWIVRYVELNNVTELILPKDAHRFDWSPDILSKLFNVVSLNIIILSNGQLYDLPPEIGLLKNLHTLDLSNNKLETLPPEIGLLKNLHTLDLSNNKLKTLPPEIGNLNQLDYLNLSSNLLKELPPEIGNLELLGQLDLSSNHLHELPRGIGRLGWIQLLNISNNKLKELTPEIGNLTTLESLDVSENQLQALPLELGNLSKYIDFTFYDNQISNIPQPILNQGYSALFTYLSQQLRGRKPLWRSKLLVVGEGGVGKTSLIKQLSGDEYSPNEDTTHGIEIRNLHLPHPFQDDVDMTLNCWDFGGQEIYHATHQFFYSNRSLFLLVWNARTGYEQGKLTYWLNTIQSLAPQSPIIIISTYLDERQPDFPEAELKRKYPQIIEFANISNKTGEGVSKLKTLIIDTSVDLPLMGEMWPEKWKNIAEYLEGTYDVYITPHDLDKIVRQYDLSLNEGDILVTWLHELGDLLYFKNDLDISDLVILQPSWVSQQISKILESKKILQQNGVVGHKDIEEIWNDAPKYVRQHLLKLMERFDLSYLIPDDKYDRSLIVELLPYDEVDYHTVWDTLKENELAIQYHFPSSDIPAGIPTWFIARSHRFTTNNHWRYGALFAHKDKRNYSLVRAFPNERYVELRARGTNPQNFFALLRDGLELTLNRFPGLEVEKKIPCPGHDGESCTYKFDLQTVELAIEKGKTTLECQHTLELVPLNLLYFGLKWETGVNQILNKIDTVAGEIKVGQSKLIKQNEKQDEIQEELKSELGELRALVHREFTSFFASQQSAIDTQCPNIFTLMPMKSDRWLQPLGEEIRLQLYCQYPEHWHPPTDVSGSMIGNYVIANPAEWLKELLPYLERLVKVLKYVTPIAGTWLNLTDSDIYSSQIQNQIEMTTDLIDNLESFPDTQIHLDAESVGFGRKQIATGADLRVIRKLLEHLDSSQQWGGLRRVLTPEGHYLWLCEHHASIILKNEVH